MHDDITRRELLKFGAGACLAMGAGPLLGCGSGRIGDDPVSGSSTVHTIVGSELSDLYSMGARAAQALGINAGRRLSGARVFIKPNLVSLGQGFYVPGNGACTKVEILVGIAEQCLLAGADRVTIGDGAHTVRWNWRSLHFFPGSTIYGKTNIGDAVNHLQTLFPNQKVELACIHAVDAWKNIPSSSEHEIMQEGLPIASSFHEADHVISVPTIKTHIMAEISCAMKNYIGIVHPMTPMAPVIQRNRVHLAYANTFTGGIQRTGIAGCFADICQWRLATGKEDFAIADGSIGVEGMGPIPAPGFAYPVDFKSRTPAGNYFLLAGNDLAAVDATAVRIMNQDIYSVKQLLLAKNLKLGKIDNIDIRGDTALEELIVEDWRRATLQVPEWGVASTLPASTERSAQAHGDRRMNTLAGLAAPAAIIYGLKRRHRKQHPKTAPKP